jgi:hypothetical protein
MRALVRTKLDESGFQLVWSTLYSCNKKHEKRGCRDELLEWGFACGRRSNDTLRQSCHNMLFVRDQRPRRVVNETADI